MKKAKVLAALLALFITAPIWFYLLWFLLKRAGAGDLQWFLFWVYVPVSLFAQLLAKLATDDDK